MSNYKGCAARLNSVGVIIDDDGIVERFKSMTKNIQRNV